MARQRKSIDEKIEDAIHDFLDRAKAASPRDAHSLSSAVKELYNCRDMARADSEADWMGQLAAAGEDDQWGDDLETETESETDE